MAEPWTVRCWPEPCGSNKVTQPQPGPSASRSLVRCDFTNYWFCYSGKFEVSVSSSIKSRGSALDSLLTWTFCFIIISIVLFYFYLQDVQSYKSFEPGITTLAR